MGRGLANGSSDGSRVRVRELALAWGLILACTLPFSARAIHIDDVYFLEVAQNVLRDPLRPFAGAVALEDIDYRVFAARDECPNSFAAMAHPPLVPYLIAGIVALAGSVHERALHLGFLGAALLAAAAMYGLSRRFTASPLTATLLLASTPIFLLSAESLMTDMPALSLSLAGLLLFVRGVDGERRRELCAAGLLLGLALLTRYSTLAMVPVLALYAHARGRSRAVLPALGASLLVFAAWGAQNLAVHGALHIVAGTRHYGLFFADQSFDAIGLLRKALADLSALGGTSFAAALLLLVPSRRRWRRLAVLGLAGLAALAVFRFVPRTIERLASYSGLEILAVCACFAVGTLLVVEAFAGEPVEPLPDAQPADPRDARFLAFWLALSLIATIALLPFGAARYVLPALPPLVILLLRRWRPLLADRRGRVAVAVIVLQGVGLGSVLGLADAELAGRYRLVARELARDHGERRLWFVGEWGFRHYMGAVGGRYLTSRSDAPDLGDLIVRPAIAGMHEISAGLRQRAVLYQRIPLVSRWPIRLLSFDAKAGYYSHHWGYLPWATSHAPLETIEILEVRAAAPPAAKDPCASS